MKRGRDEYDRAYGSFLLCGVSSLVISSLERFNPDSGTAGLLGFFVALPLAFASLGAVVFGIVQCVRLWFHWPLVLLSSMSVLLIVVMGGDDGTSSVVNPIGIAYGAIVVTICALWFLVLRRRHST